ncbi:MAG TPA: extracellular solute-binding protein [Anaerolineaceae bacterium]|nr:extracellular solute-binding protein [Anaerolineaceae bacterium]
MKKSWLFVVLIMVMLLSACGTPATPAAETEAPAAAETEAPAAEEPVATEAPAAETEAPAASGDLYTVKMIYWPGPESDAMQKVVDYFNANKSEEAGFKVEQVLFGRDQMISKQEAVMAAHSSDVDIYFIASRWLGKYHQFLEPLDDYLADPEVNIYNADPKNTLQSAVDGLKWYDGKLYAAPMDISSHFLYYRKDLMEKLLSDAAWQEAYKRISKEQMGVEMTPKAVEEWTWDDYLAASYFFTKQYNPDSPTEFGNFTHGKVMGPTAFLWTNAYWGYGGDWFDADGKPTFNNEAATQATNLWKTFFEKGLTPPSSVNGEYPECNEAMKAGQVALAIHWNAAFNELNAADSPVKDMWAVTAPPAGPEGKFTYNHTLAVSLNIDSQHKKEAARWLAFLYTEEAAKLYAEAGGIPPVESVLNGMADTRPDFAEMVKDVADSGKNLPPTAGIIETMVCENLSNAWSGDVAVEDALADLQSAAEEEMTKWK